MIPILIVVQRIAGLSGQPSPRDKLDAAIEGVRRWAAWLEPGDAACTQCSARYSEIAARFDGTEIAVPF